MKEMTKEDAMKFAAQFREAEKIAMELTRSHPANIKYRGKKYLGSIQYICPWDNEIVLCAHTSKPVLDIVIESMNELSDKRLNVTIDDKIDIADHQQDVLRMLGDFLTEMTPEQTRTATMLLYDNVEELKMDGDPDVFARNYNMPVSEVRHKELERSGDSMFRSQCPICKKGVLLMRRDQANFFLSVDDTCIMCGRRFRYVDVEEGFMELRYKDLSHL